MPHWDQENPEFLQPEAGAAPVAGEPRPRQATHKISDEEDSVVPVVQLQGQAGHGAPPAQAQGQVVPQDQEDLSELIKQQPAEVKETHKTSPQINEDAVQFLEQYLTDAQQISEIEKLTKVYPRVQNVQSMIDEG